MKFENKLRADRAQKMLTNGYGANATVDNLTDALTDFMHLCKNCALRFDDIAEQAKKYYTEETK